MNNKKKHAIINLGVTLFDLRYFNVVPLINIQIVSWLVIALVIDGIENDKLVILEQFDERNSVSNITAVFCGSEMEDTSPVR